MHLILLIRKFSRGFYFRETSQMRYFLKIEPSRNGEITMSFTDEGMSCLNMSFDAFRENEISESTLPTVRRVLLGTQHD